MVVIILTIITLIIGNTIPKKIFNTVFMVLDTSLYIFLIILMLLRIAVWYLLFCLYDCFERQYRFRKSNNIIFDIRSVSRFSYYRDEYVNVHRNSITFFDWKSLCVISFDLIEYYIISSLIICESSIALKSTPNRYVYWRIRVSIFEYWVEFNWKMYRY